MIRTCHYGLTAMGRILSPLLLTSKEKHKCLYLIRFWQKAFLSLAFYASFSMRRDQTSNSLAGKKKKQHKTKNFSLSNLTFLYFFQPNLTTSDFYMYNMMVVFHLDCFSWPVLLNSNSSIHNRFSPPINTIVYLKFMFLF